jgi:hypothetical protein
MLFGFAKMLQLIGKVKVAPQGDLDMEWLKPFTTRRTAKRGEVLLTVLCYVLYSDRPIPS